MKRIPLPLTIVLSSSVSAGVSPAQEMELSPMSMGYPELVGATINVSSGPTEGGQSSFSAIQEIVGILLSDPMTDWSRVNIEALRQHLIDMNNVTMFANVDIEDIEGGARFTVFSEDPKVSASIKRMSYAHTATMNGAMGWELTSEPTENGTILTAVGNADILRALGFVGLMTVGAHHPQHHLALAQGFMPH